MNEQPHSEQACPVCSQHTLALDQPPQIDVMGVQSYSDMVGMGDLKPPGSVGIVCLNCGSHWSDKAAFERGETDTDDLPLVATDDEFSEEDFADPDAGDVGGE